MHKGDEDSALPPVMWLTEYHDPFREYVSPNMANQRKKISLSLLQTEFQENIVKSFIQTWQTHPIFRIQPNMLSNEGAGKGVSPLTVFVDKLIWEWGKQ